jgi:hypothetical protein
LLALQRAGSGQSEMLAILRSLLGTTPEADADGCAVDPRRFLYLDDVLFTGNRIKEDLIRWVERDAPQSAEVVVAAIAMHVGGRNFAHVQIVAAAKAAGKTIDVKWLCPVLVEDRKAEIDRSDVLRPVSIPDDEPTRRYVRGMREAPLLRRPGHVGTRGFFSSEAGRHLLEQELLKAGCRIASACPGLGPNTRPLGNFIRETLGSEPCSSPTAIVRRTRLWRCGPRRPGIRCCRASGRRSAGRDHAALGLRPPPPVVIAPVRLSR